MVELISRREGRRQACVSRTTEFRLIRHDPTWPQPVDILPGGKTGYVAAEIEAWIRKRIAARDEKAAEQAPEDCHSEPVGSKDAADLVPARWRICVHPGCGDLFEMRRGPGQPPKRCELHRRPSKRASQP